MKTPAFQFYPRDWDTDENVIPMTYEEEGVYFALCRRYWLSGSLPADLDRLRTLLKGKPPLRKMQAWWVVIGPCFQVEGDRLSHKRLDRERSAQATNREQRKAAAEKRWASTRNAHASPPHTGSNTAEMQTQSTASASATSSASATAVEGDPRATPTLPDGVVPIRPPRSMGVMGSSPIAHASHGRCNDRGVCMPQSLYAEILARFNNDVMRFDAFYHGVLADMPDDYVPAGSVFAFWQNKLAQYFPDLSPSKSKLTAALEKASQW